MQKPLWRGCAQNGLQVSGTLKSRKSPENIDNTLNLTTLNPLQVKWLIKLYDEVKSESGKNVILKEWEKSGITDWIKMRRSKLPSIDPFDKLDPLGKDQDEYDLMDALSINEDWLGEGITKFSGDESEWDNPNGDKNVFILFEDSDD